MTPRDAERWRVKRIEMTEAIVIGGFMSRSQPEQTYIVWAPKGSSDILCSCPGFAFSGACWHVEHERSRIQTHGEDA